MHVASEYNAARVIRFLAQAGLDINAAVQVGAPTARLPGPAHAH